MKFTASVLLGLCLTLAAHAQDTIPSPASPAPNAATSTAAQPISPSALETLLGPIALYPDALIALILPASTAPSDVVLAARYLQAKRDPAAVENQSWGDSVKALVHYPDVVTWMDENLEWTQALGQAFVDQPTDVMNTVQRLRARAKEAGTLVSTPQQSVIDQSGTIVIVPAQPEIIYVPVYDPAVVYVRRTVWTGGPFITFSFGYPIGDWFIYDCNWSQRTVWVITRPANWRSKPQYWTHSPSHPQPRPGCAWIPPANYHRTRTISVTVTNQPGYTTPTTLRRSKAESPLTQNSAPRPSPYNRPASNHSNLSRLEVAELAPDAPQVTTQPTRSKQVTATTESPSAKPASKDHPDRAPRYRTTPPVMSPAATVMRSPTPTPSLRAESIKAPAGTQVVKPATTNLPDRRPSQPHERRSGSSPTDPDAPTS
ncbi:MAG: DUF3300 domain-containing protein [Opitutaceae bacterium]|jgi:hypothetical protein